MPSNDNPQAFKHLIGSELLGKLSSAIHQADPGFSRSKLIRLKSDLDPLELKDRVRLIRGALKELLPREYPLALSILLEAAQDPSLDGFDLWPLTDFVQTYGLGHFKQSMAALHFFTQKFTAEFALRPFLKELPEETFATLHRWSEDPNHHVRRCVSEGTRPRLPWGEQVPLLIKKPERGLELLEKLRSDPEMYVRKSVANHLNDVSKDHPDKTVVLLRRWRKNSHPEVSHHLDWITRHALRTLIKKGHPGALELIGVASNAHVKVVGFKIRNSTLRVGSVLEFEFHLESTSNQTQKLVVDYVIHFVKARGDRSPKVFKLRTFELPARGRVTLAKKHSLKPITTRTYYPGKHLLEIQINGRAVESLSWHLA